MSENITKQLVYGLDIGTRSIVGTVGYRSGKKFVVVAQTAKEHESRAMIDGQIHDINAVAQTVKEVTSILQARVGMPLKKVCIAAAGRVLKTIQVHSEYQLNEERTVNEEDIYTLHSIAIEDAYKEFLEKNNTELKFYCVGSSVVRYYLNDFAISSLENHKAKYIGVDMIGTFLPDEVVDGLYKAVEIADLEVASMTLEPIAAITLAIPDRFRLLNIALVDVGAGTSDISVTKDGSIIAFGMIPTAGDSLTEVIANHCMVDFDTAEKIKKSASTMDTVEYEDIMGLPMTISKAQIMKLVSKEVEQMADLAADKICELNGGKPVGAVFVVGGGGAFPGYTEHLAKKLGIIKERVALRGKEVMNDIIFEQSDLPVDSLLVTPIGIALSFYEETNNFIYVSFNDTKVKIYNNNNITVMDVAMLTDFPSSGFFPKSGKELYYTLNGVEKMVRGELGEPATIMVNGDVANMHTPVKENDIIQVIESVPGNPASMKIEDLPDYKATIRMVVNEKEVKLPKFVKVNGELRSGYYEIKEHDIIEILDYYTVGQIIEVMDIVPKKDTICLVNNMKSNEKTKVFENFSVTWDLSDGQFMNDYSELPEDDGTYEEIKKNKEEEATKQAVEAATLEYERALAKANKDKTKEEPKAEEKTDEQPASEDKTDEQPASEEKKSDEKTSDDNAKEVPAGPHDITVVANGKPVVLKGKEKYLFVDIFDYIDFDLTKPQGDIVTKVNGDKAVYMEEIKDGYTLDIYWEKN